MDVNKPETDLRAASPIGRTLGEWLDGARGRLERTGDLDAEADAAWMCCEALNLRRSGLRFSRGRALAAEEAERLDAWLSRREAGEPLQYILGNTGFMGLAFLCDRRALIPRCETETLCEAALARLQGVRAPRVLDLCAGSGAIGLSLAHFRPDACVTLADVSAEALDLCRANMRALGVRAEIRRGDFFAPLGGEAPFDLIVCNPPYVTRAEMDDLMREVRWEPTLALLGGADGLDFYRRLAADAPRFLTADGAVLAEVGAGQAAAVAELFRGLGSVRASQDLCGVPRVVTADRRMVESFAGTGI